MEKKKIIQISVIAAVFAVTGILAAVKYSRGADDTHEVSAKQAQSAALYGPLEADGVLDLDTLLSSGLPVLVDFGADWCAPCREFEPILRELHQELDGKAIIKYVDIMEYRDLAAAYPVQVVPTQVLFSADGKPFIPPQNTSYQFKMYSSRENGDHLYTVHEGGFTKQQLLEVFASMGMK